MRFVLRAARDYRHPLNPETLLRARRNGKLFDLLGLWLLALALIPAVGHTIALEPRLKVGYGIAGALNLLVGLVIQWDPTKVPPETAVPVISLIRRILTRPWRRWC